MQVQAQHAMLQALLVAQYACGGFVLPQIQQVGILHWKKLTRPSIPLMQSAFSTYIGSKQRPRTSTCRQNGPFQIYTDVTNFWIQHCSIGIQNLFGQLWVSARFAGWNLSLLPFQWNSLVKQFPWKGGGGDKESRQVRRVPQQPLHIQSSNLAQCECNITPFRILKKVVKKSITICKSCSYLKVTHLWNHNNFRLYWISLLLFHSLSKELWRINIVPSLSSVCAMLLEGLLPNPSALLLTSHETHTHSVPHTH